MDFKGNGEGNQQRQKHLGSHRKGFRPFNIPLKEFERLSLDEYVPLSEKAYELCKGKTKEAFKEGNIHHIVICDGEIVYKSSNIAGIASHVIKDLMRKLNKPCYIFSREDMVEEARWIKLDTDYYPTVKLLVGEETWNDEKVLNEGRRILADFDTGNPYYTILNEKFSEGIVPPHSPTKAIAECTLENPTGIFSQT